MKKSGPFTLNPDAGITDEFPGRRLIVVLREWIESTRKSPLIRDLQVTHIGHFNHASGHFVGADPFDRWTIFWFYFSGGGPPAACRIED